MTQAQEMKKKLEGIAASKAFAAAPSRQALKMLHSAAFAACESHSSDNGISGYGPAEIYRFRDGSVLVDDGRGYTCLEMRGA